ncbi:hypothetical protein [Actinospica durhamensis]
MAALGDAGLLVEVEWDGDPSRAVTVASLDWRSRSWGER